MTAGELPGHAYGYAYCWNHDGTVLYLLAVPENDWAQTTVEQATVTVSGGSPRSGDPVTITEPGRRTQLLTASSAGVLVTYWDRSIGDSGDLYRLDPETGRETRLTHHERWVITAVSDSDGDRVAYAIRNQEGGGWWTGDPVTYVHEEGTSTSLDLDGPARPVAWRNGQQCLLLNGGDDERGVGIWNGDDVTWLGEGTPRAFHAEDGVMASQAGGPVVLGSDGDVEIAWPSIMFSNGTNGIGIEEDEDESKRLYGGPVTGDVTTLLSVAPEVPKTDFAKPTETSYVDSAGEDAPVQVSLPEETPAPVLVHLYGVTGDLSRYQGSTHRALQWFVDRGYALVEPGHGGERYSTRRHADHAAVGKWVRERDWATDQVVAIGHSSGGFDVLMQLTRTPEAWTAGVAWNPMVSLRGIHETMTKDRPFLEAEVGSPVDNPGRWRRLDPFEHLDTAEGPLLLLEGEHDALASQVRDLRDALKAHHVDIEYEQLADEWHFSRALDQKTRRWRYVDDFLKRQLSDPL